MITRGSLLLYLSLYTNTISPHTRYSLFCIFTWLSGTKMHPGMRVLPISMRNVLLDRKSLDLFHALLHYRGINVEKCTRVEDRKFYLCVIGSSASPSKYIVSNVSTIPYGSAFWNEES